MPQLVHLPVLMAGLAVIRFLTNLSIRPPLECPGGWQFCADPHNLPFFYCPQIDLGYSLRDISIDPNVSYRVCWGREKSDSLCWAGFAIQLHPAKQGRSALVCRYSVIFENEQGKEIIND